MVICAFHQEMESDLLQHSENKDELKCSSHYASSSQIVVINITICYFCGMNKTQISILRKSSLQP